MTSILAFKKAKAPAPATCEWCGRGDYRHNRLLRCQTPAAGGGEPAWVHIRCWASWNVARSAEALAALAEAGIEVPAALKGKSRGTEYAMGPLDPLRGLVRDIVNTVTDADSGCTLADVSAVRRDLERALADVTKEEKRLLKLHPETA